MKIKHLFLVACAALWGVSCSHSELEESAFEPNTTTHTLSVEGTLADFDVEEETRASGVSVIRLEWSAGDKISVINLTTGKALGGDLTADESGSVTTFSGEITGTLNSGDKLALLYPSQNYIEEQDYTPVTIDFSEQSGTSSVPLCVYATFDYSGKISGIKAKFDYLMAYVRMNLADLTQNANLRKVEISNVSNSMTLNLTGNDLIPNPKTGVIVLKPEKATGTNHVQTLFFTTPASSTTQMRQVYIRQNYSWKVANWTTATLRTAGLYNTVVGDFVDTNDAPIVDPDAHIIFADASVKTTCVANWDTNGDGELSFGEAAAVTTLGSVFKGKTITSFDEFGFFTGLTAIPNNAFDGCSSLKSISIPESVAEIGDAAFNDCSGLIGVYISSIEAWCNIHLGAGNSNPLRYARNLYLNGELATDLVIPDSVTQINYKTFHNCGSITSVFIPDSVTVIGEAAFYDCNCLKSVTIGNSVTTIKKNAFWGCSSLTSVSIPESVTEIGEAAFNNCSGLTGVYISSIEAWCNIKFNSSAGNPLRFADNLYLNGELVTDLVIPESVTSIKDYTFYNCKTLTSVVIPDSVTSIGVGAFYSCSGLTNVIIPALVTEIENYTFQYCSGLTSVTIPDSVTVIKIGAFYDCISLKSITIPNSVTTIGIASFRGCTSLTSVVIPDSVTTIEEACFGSCSGLKSITIGRAVTTIGNYAFCNCSSLAGVYCKPVTPPTGGTRMFDNNASGRKIYVPTASVSKYKAATYWKDYSSSIVGYKF